MLLITALLNVKMVNSNIKLMIWYFVIPNAQMDGFCLQLFKLMRLITVANAINLVKLVAMLLRTPASLVKQIFLSDIPTTMIMQHSNV